MPRRWKLALFAGAPFVVAIAPLMVFAAFVGSPSSSQQFDLRDGSAVVTPNSLGSSGVHGAADEAAMRGPDGDPVALNVDDDCAFGRSGAAES